MKVENRKLHQDEVNTLTSLFKYSDPKSELEKIALNIATGQIDIFV